MSAFISSNKLHIVMNIDKRCDKQCDSQCKSPSGAENLSIIRIVRMGMLYCPLALSGGRW